MATVHFQILTDSETAPIYVRVSVKRGQTPRRKTGFVIAPKDWSKENGLPIGRDAELKKLKYNLERLKFHLTTAYNTATAEQTEIDAEWLQREINVFNGVTTTTDEDINLLSNYIQKIIDEAPHRENPQQKKIGLSSGRIRNLKLFKNTILRFEADTAKGKKFTLVDVNRNFVARFKSWLFKNGYSVNYVAKNLANLKTVLQDAKNNDFETSSQNTKIQVINEAKEAGEIVYLSFDELEQIANAPIISTALNNARKWLLLGCYLGQRGGDLLKLTEKNVKDLNGLKIVELQQQKTGKKVAIPLPPDALEIIKDGFPYPIALTKFNEYLKDVCEIAKIDTPTTGRIKEHSRGATVKTTAPKHQFISSHVCRRSFASNYYSKIPTSILIGITAHATEQMFLRYIGKTSYDNAYQFMEYFTKLTPRAKTEPKMDVILNTGTNK